MTARPLPRHLPNVTIRVTRMGDDRHAIIRTRVLEAITRALEDRLVRVRNDTSGRRLADELDDFIALACPCSTIARRTPRTLWVGR